MPTVISYLLHGGYWFIYPIALGLALATAYWVSRQFTLRWTTQTGESLAIELPRPAIFLVVATIFYLSLHSLLQGAYSMLLEWVQVTNLSWLRFPVEEKINLGFILVVDLLVIFLVASLMLLAARRRPEATGETKGEGKAEAEGKADE